MRLGHRTIVEAEDPHDNTGDFFRHRQSAGASAKGPFGNPVSFEPGPKGGGEIGKSAGEFDRAFGDTGAYYTQIVFVGERVNPRQIVRVRAAKRRELLAAEVTAFSWQARA